MRLAILSYPFSNCDHHQLFDGIVVDMRCGEEALCSVLDRLTNNEALFICTLNNTSLQVHPLPVFIPEYYSV